MRNRGHNTLGYGSTMDVVKEGHKLGLNAVQIAKQYGITYAAVRGGAYRLGIILPLVNGRAGYGHVKTLVFSELGSGLTVRQIAEKHGLKLSSVKAVNGAFDLGISRRNKRR
jgi:hypothetical protein